MDTQKSLHKQLLEFQKENIVIPRRGKGKVGDREYNYATLDDLLNAIKPKLLALGLYFTQVAEGGYLFTKIIYPETNEVLTSSLAIGSPTSSQDLGSRITYFRRYMLISMLGLSTEEDVDAASKGELPTSGINSTPTTPAVAPTMAPALKEAPTKEVGQNNFKELSAGMSAIASAEKSGVVPNTDPTASVNIPHQATVPAQPSVVENPTVQKTLDQQGEVSPAMQKAIGAIDSCQNPLALKQIEGFIKTSTKITEGEKEELYKKCADKMAKLDGAGIE